MFKLLFYYKGRVVPEDEGSGTFLNLNLNYHFPPRLTTGRTGRLYQILPTFKAHSPLSMFKPTRHLTPGRLSNTSFRLAVMHNCLQIQEIVRNIVSFEDAPLLSMALASRAFYEPAMDELWYSLQGPDIAPLVVLLPEHYLRYHPYSRRLSIVGQPQYDDWARFQHHARRVRDLRLSGNPGSRVDNSVWEVLYRSFPGRYPLPNLDTVSFCEVYANEYFQMLLPPTVQDAEIEHYDYANTLWFLESLPACPSITRLALLEISVLQTDEMVEILSKAVCSLPQLEVLNTGRVQLQQPALTHVASLPNLWSFSYMVGGDDVDYQALLGSFTQPLVPFPSLTSLSIQAYSWDSNSIVEFLNVLSRARLEELWVSFGGADEPELGDWKTRSTTPGLPTARYMDCVTKAISKMSTLQFIDIFVEDEQQQCKDLLFDDRSLDPLLRLRGLQTLYLAHTPVSLKPESLHQIVKSWSSIHTLSLGDNCNLKDVGPFKVEDILVLADCPKLTSLGALIDDTMYAAIPTGRAHGQSKSVVRTLYLGVSEINGSSAHLAALLYGAFPLVQVVWDDTEYDPEDEIPVAARCKGSEVNEILGASREADGVETQPTFWWMKGTTTQRNAAM